MKIKVVARRFFALPKNYWSVVMLLVLFAGLAGSGFAVFMVDSQERNSLSERTLAIADSLRLDSVKMLQANTIDLTSPAYSELQERLTRIRSDNPEVRRIYLTGLRNGSVVYLAGSEPEKSATHVLPGEAYLNPSKRYSQAFYGSSTFIEGPYKEYGAYWVSARAPIIDTASNQVLAYVNIDMPVAGYLLKFLVYGMVPLLLAAIPFAGMLRDRKLEEKERYITQLKSQFVSIASHELRSPLNGMLWAIQTFLKPGATANMSKEQQELLVDMYHSTESSLTTVNEILDFSIFERGQVGKLQHDIVDLIPVISEARKTLKLGAEEKAITIHISRKWPASVYVNGDVAGLKRAFMNIIANAIKYSPEKTSVVVTYQLKGDEHIIAVADHGIGIPKAEQEKVLEGYYRASNAVKQQAHGTGLGLWVSKLMFEEHDGSLWLESEEGKGTTVFVRLPVADMPSQQNTQTTTKSKELQHR